MQEGTKGEAGGCSARRRRRETSASEMSSTSRSRSMLQVWRILIPARSNRAAHFAGDANCLFNRCAAFAFPLNAAFYSAARKERRRGVAARTVVTAFEIRYPGTLDMYRDNVQRSGEDSERWWSGGLKGRNETWSQQPMLSRIYEPQAGA
eukprot:604960-Rhodomonas_salina.1